MEFKIYFSNCPKCRDKTEHSIHSISRSRGLKCGKIKDRYYKANLLQEKIK